MPKIGDLSNRISDVGLSTKTLLESYIKVNFFHSGLRKKLKTRNEVEALNFNWAESLFNRRLRQLKEANKVQDIQVVRTQYLGLAKLVDATVAPTQVYEDWLLRRLYNNRFTKLLPPDIISRLNHEVFWAKDAAVAKTILKTSKKRAVQMLKKASFPSPARQNSIMSSHSEVLSDATEEAKAKLPE